MKYKTWLGLAMLSLALAGCGGGGDSANSPSTPPVTPPSSSVTFTADKASYNVGDIATLTPVFPSGASGRIEPGVGAVQSGVAVKTPVLTDNTQYKLIVTQNGSDTTVPLNLAVSYRNRYTMLDWPMGRSGYGSAVLPNGDLLYSGGNFTFALGAYDDGVYGFRKATGEQYPSGKLLTYRRDHLMTTTADGKLLVTGGDHYAFENRVTVSGPDVELYDPSTLASVALSPMRYQSVRGQTATLLPSGKILFVGGAATTWLANAWLWDPKTQAFTESGSTLATPRAFHSATLLSSGKVLIAGGQTATGSVQYAELYDPTNDRFTPVSGGPTSISFRELVVTRADGNVLLLGGVDVQTDKLLQSAYRYDPASNSLTALPNLTQPLMTGARVTLANGDMLVFGGPRTRDGGPFYLSKQAFRYTAAGEIKPLADIAAAREGAVAMLAGNGKIVIFGGEAQSDPSIVYGATLVYD